MAGEPSTCNTSQTIVPDVKGERLVNVLALSGTRLSSLSANLLGVRCHGDLWSPFRAESIDSVIEASNQEINSYSRTALVVNPSNVSVLTIIAVQTILCTEYNARMDQEQGSYRGIGRLSRLPRASASTVPEIHQDDLNKASNASRPPPSISTRNKNGGPLTENTNATIKSRFGFGTQSLSFRSKSPIKVALSSIATSNLETTPPKSHENGIDYKDADENATIHEIFKIDQTRKRAQSPSPSRRRSSTVSSTGSIGRSVRAKSTSKDSRSSTEPPSVSTLPAFDLIYTPPKALVRDQGSRIAKLSRSPQRTTTKHNDDGYLAQFQRPNRIPHGHKVKSMYNLRGAAAKSATSHPPLPSIFKDPPRTPAPCGKLHLSSMDGNGGLLKPRSPGENVLAASPRVATKQIKTPEDEINGPTKAEDSTDMKPSSKSSSALRDTIAKAKAQKRRTAIRSQEAVNPGQSHQYMGPETSDDQTSSMSKQSLKQRLRTALTTGHLNISAQGLKTMPEEILKMYDFDENSDMNWAEAVDLTKLIMADNEIGMLHDDAFPDWTMDELTEDDEKNNIFAGLEILDLHGNRLTTLPVGLRRLERLHTLNVSNNKLTMDALHVICQIPNLKVLNLAGNDLAGALSEKITRLHQLQILDLHNNKLSEIPAAITRLCALQKLDVSSNILSHLPSVALQSSLLVELDISYNRLTGTLFERVCLKQLHQLNVSRNQLTRLCDGDVSMPQLQTLTMDNNLFAEIPEIVNLSNLMTLTVSHNQLEDIPHGFTLLQKMRHTDFSANNIKVIDVNISTMKDLISLNLDGNPLRERKHIGMNAEDLKAELARRLEAADGSGDIPHQNPRSSGSESASASKPKYLYAPENGILNLSSLSLTSIDPELIDLTKPVHTIRLSNNDLTTFPTTLLSHPNIKYSLKSLDISHNPSLHPTTYLSDSIHLPLLQSLYIVSTGLESLDTLTTNISAPELKELNISCHKLTGHVPWVKAWFPSLTTLLATDNWFTSVDTEAVRGLEVLDIRNNEIDFLPPKIGELGHFQEGKHEPGRLRSFDCSGNRFRIPRLAVLEKGTEATLRDLRRMVPLEAMGEEWKV